MGELENSRLIDATLVNTTLRKRNREIHKGQCGRILILAGSPGMAGAAVLCAKGALRSGAGLVTVSVPEELIPIVQSSVPEAICISRSISKEKLAQYDAIVLGPGLGVDAEQGTLIEALLEQYHGTLVLDADALTWLSRAGESGWGTEGLKSAKSNLILTPHPGEAARILGSSIEEVQQDRRMAALALHRKTGAVVVLKGAGTIVATGDQQTYINLTGNPGMATGGSGDVLAGIIASLAGQGLDPQQSALAGVYLHGLAGDLKALQWGEYGLIASDLADGAALAIKKTMEDSRLQQLEQGYAAMSNLNQSLSEEGLDQDTEALKSYEKLLERE